MKKLLFLPILIIFGLILIPTQNVFSESAYEGQLITSPVHTSVYKVENGKRRPFFNEPLYKTWYSDFDSVKTITVEEVEAIELGNPMPIKPNTKLLKFPLNPKTYAVTSDDTIQHIPDEETAITLFGTNWAYQIIELPEIYYLFYTKGPALQKQSALTDSSLSQLIVASGVDANHPYVKNSSISVCTKHESGTGSYSKLIRNSEQMDYGNTVATGQMYTFCLPSSWNLKINETQTTYLYFDMPYANLSGNTSGQSIMDTTVTQRIQEIKDNASAKNVEVHEVNNITIVKHEAILQGVDEYYIEVMGAVFWEDFITENFNASTVFRFSGDIAAHKTELNDFVMLLKQSFEYYSITNIQ